MEGEISLKVPSWCPLCGLYMSNVAKSISSYYAWGVCTGCVIQYIEGREERWKTGWRPDPADVQRYVDSL